MKVLLTGGSGMLGRTIRDVFGIRRPGIEVLAPSHSELDLIDSRAVHEYIRHARVDLVVHCAAKVGGIQANIQDPVAFLGDNALMSLNVIHAALESGVSEMFYMGSSCMYPRDYLNPLKEENLLAAPLEPTNEGYALAKILGAKLCEYCNRQFGTRYKTLIPCNLYGRYDHYDPVKSHLIAAVLLKLHEAKQAGEDAVTVWGEGTARREFLYCDDLAEFICDSLERTSSLPDYLNVGYGQDFSVLEYYQMGGEIVGFRGRLEFDLNKPGGMSYKLLDSSRAVAYGWRPKIPPREGMARAYEYFLRTRTELAIK